ncbi:MAG: hypothetical protein LBE92_10765 [Chryseobacterium sp.]|jgi:hypothetical protein|uniref:hypothetical protein n=1 Tax=Chryseobacterium sp. TaxID=1871047 RepID=UPI0028251627|nr:hypothetical protein [Chryseobacterium sp.]MDR2236597.1 hypothetical protein [Chryseobacterium sp.]
MKKYINIVFVFVIIISCKKLSKQSDSQNTKPIITENKKFMEFKEFGNVEITKEIFPVSWLINTYDNENIVISKKDKEYQKKFEQIDYFKNLKEGIKTNDGKLLLFIKKDSLLNLSKIDSLNIIDSTIINEQNKIYYLKIIANRDDGKTEYPIDIYRLDMVLYNKGIPQKNINLYTEIDFPYLTKQNICYLDKYGQVTCSEFIIEEAKVTFKGRKNQDAKKIFNIN